MCEWRVKLVVADLANRYKKTGYPLLLSTRRTSLLALNVASFVKLATNLFVDPLRGTR